MKALIEAMTHIDNEEVTQNVVNKHVACVAIGLALIKEWESDPYRHGSISLIGDLKHVLKEAVIVE